MKYTGITYRPPFEASSLLLQVTSGCSHNKCTFCTMYRDVPFQVETMQQIEKDLNEAMEYAPYIKRVFLENGDPFVLSADKLEKIAVMIHEKLPKVETIAMYASIGNVRTKTDEELKRLRKLGINELNIGVESGLDEVLAMTGKGYSCEEAVSELLRLKSARIDYGLNIIFGAAGAGKGAENAIATADLVNQTQPYLIFTGTIHADPGCPLYEDLQSGKFVENTVEEYLDEEKIFMEHLQLKDCYYFGLHPSNIVQMEGWFGRDNGSFLKHIEQKKNSLSPEQLRSRPTRRGEGAVLL